LLLPCVGFNVNHTTFHPSTSPPLSSSTFNPQHTPFQGSENAGKKKYRILAIKGTSDIYSVIDDLRIYTEIVLFQLMHNIFLVYSYTIGRIIDESTFIRILNVTIAPKDIAAQPEVKSHIRDCINRSIQEGIDVTLTGHSLGGGVALHLANECAFLVVLSRDYQCDFCEQIPPSQKHDI
jgi:hypothetical protein